MEVTGRTTESSIDTQASDDTEKKSWTEGGLSRRDDLSDVHSSDDQRMSKKHYSDDRHGYIYIYIIDIYICIYIFFCMHYSHGGTIFIYVFHAYTLVRRKINGICIHIIPREVRRSYFASKVVFVYFP